MNAISEAHDNDPNVGQNCRRCGNWTSMVFRDRIFELGLCGECYRRLYNKLTKNECEVKN